MCKVCVVTCLLVVVSQVRDLSLLSITPRPWKRPGLLLSVLGSLMLLTQEIDLTILLSAGRGLMLSALSTAWSMLTSLVKFLRVTQTKSAPSGVNISSQ